MEHDTARIADNQYEHLKLVLSFFPRADSKTQFLTGLVIGMLGFLVSVVTVSTYWTWAIAASSAAAIALLAGALLCLYQASYPNLSGGEASLIYFAEISKMREAAFVDAVTALSEQQLAADLSAQVWRNSQILTAKFLALKRAHRLTLIAVFPWFCATLISMMIRQHGGMHLP